MLSKTPRAFRPTLLPAVWVLLVGFTCFAQTSQLAADSPPTCGNLSVVLSRDKSHYTFTVHTASNSSAITGYRFDFGDHQSYTFAFAAAGTYRDRSQAMVTHTYASRGVYTAVAFIETSSHGKVADITSPACHAVVTNGPTKLLNTGAGNTPALFVVALLAGFAFSEVWLRCFRRPGRNLSGRSPKEDTLG